MSGAINHLQMRKRNQDTLFVRSYIDDNAAQQFFLDEVVGMSNLKETVFQMKPIGQIRRENDEIWLEVFEPYRAGLLDLEKFSHVTVVWWAHHLDDPESRQILRVRPPYAAEMETGVYSTRSPRRPNPVLMTVCRMLGLDAGTGILRLENIDAMDETPVVDLKPYIPVTDRVQEVCVPEWMQAWPDQFPAEGIGLEEYNPQETD